MLFLLVLEFQGRKKNKRNSVQKKKLIDSHCESNMNNVSEEHVSSSDNIASC